MNRSTSAFMLVVVIEGLQLLVAAGANAQPAPPPPSPHLQPQVSRVLLDMNGDGIDLGGCSKSTGRRGPKAGADDRLLAIDIVQAAKAGYRIVSTEGERGPVVMVGSGLRVTLPTGIIHEPVDGWSTIAMLDSNRDGMLGDGDLCWPSMRLVHDANGDGAIQSDEVELLVSQGVILVGPRSLSAPRRDAFGNDLDDGAFTRFDRTVGRMADVSLASCDAPRDAGLLTSADAP